MWYLLILLSTATSLVRVAGRPQDLSKLPPDDAAVTTTREFLTRGADGASWSETGDSTALPPAAADDTVPDRTQAYDESTRPEQTPDWQDIEPTDIPSGDTGDENGESSNAGDSSAADESSGGAVSSEDAAGSSAAGQEDDEGADVAEETSTIASTTATPPPAVAETAASEPATTATEPTAETAPVVTEAVSDAAQRTEEAVTEAETATAAPPTEAATEEPDAGFSPATEEPVTEAAIAAEEPATEAIPATEAPTAESSVTFVSVPDPTTVPVEAEPAATEVSPEPTPADPTAFQSGGEPGEAATDAPGGSAAVTFSSRAPSEPKVGVQKTGKLEVSPSARMDAADAAAAEDGDTPQNLVELDDVYSQGVTSRMSRTPMLKGRVQNTLKDVFMHPREVAYRLGRHTVNTYVTDLVVTGIDDMQVMEISSSIDEMSLNVTFQFPNISFSGQFNATGSISGMKKPGVLTLRTPFPSYGSGYLTAVITDTTAVSQAELSHSYNDRKLSIELLTCHLTFGEPKVTLSDVRLPRALRKLHFERLFQVALGKMISHQLTAEIEPKVDESLYDVITDVLGRVTLAADSPDDFVRLESDPDAWLKPNVSLV